MKLRYRLLHMAALLAILTVLMLPFIPSMAADLSGMTAKKTLKGPQDTYITLGFATSDAYIIDIFSSSSIPRNVMATTNNSTVSNITWSAVEGASNYTVIRDGVNISGLIGNVTSYEDATADAPTITPGTAAATDGSSTANVTLTLTGALANNGTTHTYEVRSYYDGTYSTSSAPAYGYRAAGTLTLDKWVRADNAAFTVNSTDLGSTNPYADESGTANVTYYYRAVLSATGATSANSTADTGYKANTDEATPAILTTVTATDITTVSATSGGNIQSTGSSDVIERGIYYGLTENPTTYQKKETPGPYGTGIYTYSLTELTPGTTYHVRAYAINGFGTSYGPDQAFTTTALPATYAPSDDYFALTPVIKFIPGILLLAFVIVFGFMGFKEIKQSQVVSGILYFSLSFLLIGVILVVAMPLILSGAESIMWFK